MIKIYSFSVSWRNFIMVWNFAGCRLLENVISKVIQPIKIIHLESKKKFEKGILKNQITWLKPYSPRYSFAIYGFIATASHPNFPG